jgi:hypothetical protein
MKKLSLILSSAVLLGSLTPAVGGMPAVAQRNWDRGYHSSRPPYDDRYDRGRYRDQGGIGPGKGALIGGGAGAVLGGLLGGGMKGALIGGAVGAGGGALLGKANQNSKRRDWRDGNRYRYR